MKIAFFFYVAFIGFALWLGEFCVNYTLLHTIHKTLPVIWAVLISVVTADLTIVAAIVVKVLVVLGYLT
jgi:hypothetical protein